MNGRHALYCRLYLSVGFYLSVPLQLLNATLHHADIEAKIEFCPSIQDVNKIDIAACYY